MFMRVIFVAGALVAMTGLAQADSNSDKVAPANALTVAQVTSRLQSEGFNVSKIKFDDGRYKVKATDGAGHKQKLSVDPTTGAVVSKGDDDDNDD